MEDSQKILKNQVDKHEQEVSIRMRAIDVRKRELDAKFDEIESDMVLIQQWRTHLEEKERLMNEKLNQMEMQLVEERTASKAKVAGLEKVNAEQKALFDTSLSVVTREKDELGDKLKAQVLQYESTIGELKVQINSLKLSKVQDITELHKSLHYLRTEQKSESPSLSKKFIGKSPSRDFANNADGEFKTPERPKSVSRSTTPNKSSKVSSSMFPNRAVPIDENNYKRSEAKPSPWSVADIKSPGGELSSEDYVRYYMHN